MVALKFGLNEYEYSEKTYIDNCKFSVYYDKSTKFDPSLLSNNVPSWMGMCKSNPFSSCLILKRPLIVYIGDHALFPQVNETLLGPTGILKNSPMRFWTRKFATDAEVDSYVRDQYYGSSAQPAICVGIAIKGSGNDYEVKLRYDANYALEETTKTQQIPSPLKPVIDPLDESPKDKLYEMYHSSGFVYFQFLFTKILGGASINSLKVGSLPMASAKYTKSDFYEVATYLIGVCMGLCYLFSIFRIISMIVQDKETKAREGMKMMGLTDSAYWCSLLFYYVVIFLVISLVLATLLCLLVFTRSNWFLIFIYYFLYGLSIFTFSFFMSSLFHKAKIASVMTAMCYFAIYFLTNYLLGEVIDLDISETIKSVASLLPTVVTVLGGNTFVKFERNEKGVNFSTVNVLADNFSFTHVLLLLVANIFLYGIIGLYLDNVIPTPSGIRQPIFYFLSSDYWCSESSKKNRSDIKADSEDLILYPNSNFEKAGEDLRTQELLGECLKIRHLKKKFGVKTSVVDLSINIYRGQIFSLLGPNGAGKTTTISMLSGLLPPTSGEATFGDIDMFKEMAKIRQNLGVCPQHDVLFEMLTPREHLEIFSAFKGRASAQEKVEEILEDIDMGDSADVITENLSGGQRRKLSIGIAFIGNSDIIFLDEPTSGIDLTARKSVWTMLKKYKQNKIIILTTHYMEEAEELGDRIGIMTHGVLKCLGSPLFLKTTYGAGYTLTLVHKEVPQSEQERLHNEITNYFKSHVDQIVLQKQSESLLTYFLPKGQEANLKRLFIDLDKKLNALKILSYGMATNSLEDIFLKVANEDDERNEASKDKDKAEKIDNEQLEDYTITKEPDPSFCRKFGTHFAAVFVKRVHIATRNCGAFIAEILLPMIVFVIGLCLSMISTFYESDPRWLTPDLYGYQSVVVNTKDSLSFSTSAFSSSLDQHFRVSDYNLAFSSSSDGVAVHTMEAYLRNSGRYGSILINKFDSVNKDYEYIIFAETKSQDSAGAFMNYFSQAMLRAVTGDNNFKLTFVNAPLPITFEAKGRDRSSKATVIAPVLVAGFALVAGSLVAFIVKEREDNLKHQQIITGLSLAAYWPANCAIDIIKSIIPCAFALALMYGLKVNLPYDWLILLLYSIVIIPFSYATSFLFSKENFAQVFTMVLHFSAGMLCSPMIYILRMLDPTRSAGKIISWFLRIFPSFCLSDAIFSISSRDLYAIFEKIEPQSYMHLNIAGGNIMMLCLVAAISIIMLILIESGVFTCLSKPCKVANEAENNTDKDEFVIKEEKYCEELSLDYNPPAILAMHMNKIYKLSSKETKVAVEDATFGFHKGECFALLGTSGAGKTTILKMLTRNIDPNAGQMYINGMTFQKDFAKIRKLIGYGPQYDSAYMCLTVKENLEFYAKLKGISSKIRRQLIDKLIHDMDLTEFRNIQVGNLSGGNKRKTTVAIALLGNPPIVLLDEPSTGVDPQSRRFMWQVIQRVTVKNKEVAVLLTTHSMEEAEYLCTKMGILINGRFRCIGKPQELKEHLGKGYEIQVSIPSPSKEEELQYLQKLGFNRRSDITHQDVVNIFQQFDKLDLVAQLQPKGSATHIMAELTLRKTVKAALVANYFLIQQRGFEIGQDLADEFGEVKVSEHIGSFFKFRADKSKEKHTMGFVFNLLQDIVTSYGINQYSASQTSLNHIFQSLARMAEYGLQVGHEALVIKARNTNNAGNGSNEDTFRALVPNETIIEMDQNAKLNC